MNNKLIIDNQEFNILKATLKFNCYKVESIIDNLEARLLDGDITIDYEENNEISTLYIELANFDINNINELVGLSLSNINSSEVSDLLVIRNGISEFRSEEGTIRFKERVKNSFNTAIHFKRKTIEIPEFYENINLDNFDLADDKDIFIKYNGPIEFEGLYIDKQLECKVNSFIDVKDFKEKPISETIGTNEYDKYVLKQ